MGTKNTGKKPSTNTPEKREAADLKRAIKALDSTSHNPIQWAPVVAFVAPIVARIAARFVMRAIARQLNRKISTKIREETVLKAADYVANIAVKKALK